MKRRRLRMLTRLFLAVMLAISLSSIQGIQAKDKDKADKKPILTKSGKKDAIKKAAEKIKGLAPMKAAAPAAPYDQTKVPHYFGPFPNWANSPFTVPDAAVTITGNGQGAEATATVGANGVITGIVVTKPGSGYTTANVSIAPASPTGTGSGAQATAVVNPSGVLTAIAITAGGSGYTQPTLTVSGGGATTNATATVYGGVDAITLTSAGTSYQFPTIDIDLPDYPDGVPATAHVEWDTATGVVTGIVVDSPGSGYSRAPNVVIRDGTIYTPINNGGTGATAVATLTLQTAVVETFGAGYSSSPVVAIADPTGTGAVAQATTDFGAITAINLVSGGSGYLTAGIRKFVDTLPRLGPSGANNLGQYLSVAAPDTTTFTAANGFNVESDYYEIALVEYKEKMHSDLPAATLRGYVQLSRGTSGIPLFQPDGITPIRLPNGNQAYGVDKPHYLGPTIVAQKDRPVRITFFNLLPTGLGGDLFLPVDTTLAGSGPGNMTDPYDPTPTTGGTVADGVRNPECTVKTDRSKCFSENRATLHLHGGLTPWISDGTPHQWITPAGESTQWPEGVSVESVPDMVGLPTVLGVPDCSNPADGCMTFYYTNQQSARLLFYHDHAWGTTRLNVYAGEAAGYMITDSIEQNLITNGVLPNEQIPLIIQDRTFIPRDEQLLWQDPTWDPAWGTFGGLWYHHVYMPAQNPGDPGGMSAYGRWMYGPWFWPPFGDAKYGPIANPYYNMDPNAVPPFSAPLAKACSLDDPTTWQYQTDPFCEPALIPGTPNISAGMEQFNDTPLVNGTAYPTVTLQPKTYRFRVLNAANDRFFNLQWYVGDPTTASTATNSLGEAIGPTEVALKAAELAAAQLDPTVFPTPDTTVSLPGPDWIAIGNEGGFLPAPVVVDGQQFTTWITDPTRFDVGNVDLHSLLVAPAERADVIVDFSKFAGKTLILYNDAPAAFPARVPSYDYYTGAPDLSPAGAPTILPGFGPNTRTIMQVKIAAATPAPAFNLTNLQTAFRHNAAGTGVFESGQHPIIVGQAAYNSAYGKTFAAAGDCTSPTSTIKCDGYARINQQGGDPFTFDTLYMLSNGTYPPGYSKLSVPLQPKSIHDEMNSSAFDEFGRMQANIGLEQVPATPGMQNVMLYQYTSPPTEIINGTNLPMGGVKVTPIASASDGTQIWKITHNGVDTHPIHFHLYDVQILNRVTWDNIIIPPDPTELGWKETVRVSPLEDTIVALRPVIPNLPFDIPNSIRLLSPMLPEGAIISSATINQQLGLAPTIFDPTGQAVDLTNHYVNLGWEYVWHCHILSHEEMDMMRPQLLALPPWAPSNLAVNPPSGSGATRTVGLSWVDKSRSETGFAVERAASASGPWTQIAALNSTTGPAVGGTITYNDTINQNEVFTYRVRAINVVGDSFAYPRGSFPTVTTYSAYTNPTSWGTGPAAPTNLIAVAVSGTRVNLSWTDNATTETGFAIERCTGSGCTNFAQIATAPARTGTGAVTYSDTSAQPGLTYSYRVAAVSAAGRSYSNVASVTMPAVPVAPTGLTATVLPGPQVRLNWTDNATNETGYIIERCTGSGCSNFARITTIAPFTGTGPATYTDSTVQNGTTYRYRVVAQNAAGFAYSNSVTVAVTGTTPPAAPTGLSATVLAGPQVRLDWTDNASNETGFAIERCTGVSCTNFAQIATAPAVAGTGPATYTDATVQPGTTYQYRVAAVASGATSTYSNVVSVAVPGGGGAPAAPTNLSASILTGPQIRLNWTDNATNETGFIIERCTGAGCTSFAQIATAPALGGTGAVTYTDTTAQFGRTYQYRVAAVASAVTSPYSNVILTGAPLAPTGLSTTVLAGPQVRLNWTDNATNETGFIIERCAGAGCTNLGRIATVPAVAGTGPATYTDATVQTGTTYRYRVVSNNGAGYGYSSIVAVTP